MILLFSLVSDSFFTLRNLTNIVTQNTYFIIVAIGLSFVLISGGIDLSVGYQMSLVGVITAMMMVLWDFPVWAAIIIGLVLGTVLGLDQRVDRDAHTDVPPHRDSRHVGDLPGDLVHRVPGPYLPGLSGVVPVHNQGPHCAASRSTSI